MFSTLRAPTTRTVAFRGFATKPSVKPANPEFSSGPCKKRPGWSLAALPTSSLGRSHRSKIGKERLKLAIDKTKAVLGIPDDYHVGIVPASDTGAYEMAMWSMLGERPVDMCHWESFGKGWFGDAKSHLKLEATCGVTEHTAEYGSLPDFTKTNPDHDICFTWNGTTSGVCVPNGDWIADDRKGAEANAVLPVVPGVLVPLVPAVPAVAAAVAVAVAAVAAVVAVLL